MSTINKYLPLLFIYSHVVSAAIANNQQAGQVIASKGEVKAQKDNTFRNLKRRSKIFSNEIIRTGTGAFVRIRCNNREIISLPASATFNSNQCLANRIEEKEGAIKSYLKARSASVVSSRSTQTAQAPVSSEAGTSGNLDPLSVLFTPGTPGATSSDGTTIGGSPDTLVVSNEFNAPIFTTPVDNSTTYPILFITKGEPAYIEINSSGELVAFRGTPPATFGAGTGSGFGTGYTTNSTGAFGNAPIENLQGSTANTIEEPELSMENN